MPDLHLSMLRLSQRAAFQTDLPPGAESMGVDQMKEPLDHCRGLSDPFYFSFNVLDKGRRMLCHAVILGSFEVSNDNTNLELATLDRDPRMKAFVEYVWENFLKERKAELDKALSAAEQQIKKDKAAIAQLEHQIIQKQKGST
jgi:hypothetical protein